MSAITLVNSIAEALASTAEFRLFQGINRIARVGVHAGGKAVIPTTTEYSVQATTSMGEFTLTSNPVNFEGTSILLIAQVLSEGGQYDFQLVGSPGVQPGAIALENTWTNPVQFKLTRPNSPFQIVTVVDENNDTEISTAQQWTVYAIINGITTQTVTVTDPNATVTAVANNGDGFTLVVS